MDATSKELSQSTKLLLAAATQLAITLATQRRQALQKAATQSEQTARQVQKLQNAELAAAKPMIAKAEGDLDALSPQDLADTYQACQTWKDIDPTAKQGSATIEAHLDALDPTWKDTSQTANLDAPPAHKRSSATDQELRAALDQAIKAGDHVVFDPEDPEAILHALQTGDYATFDPNNPEAPLSVKPNAETAKIPDMAAEVLSRIRKRAADPNTQKDTAPTATAKAAAGAAVTTARLGKLAAVDAWATEQLKNGASPDYVRGMKLAKLTQPSDPTKRSTIGLHDDDGPNSLTNNSSLTL